MFRVMQVTHLDLAAFDARHGSCGHRYDDFDGATMDDTGCVASDRCGFDSMMMTWGWSWTNWEMPHSGHPLIAGWSMRAHFDCLNWVLGFGCDAYHTNRPTNKRISHHCLAPTESAVDLMCRDRTYANRSCAVLMDSFYQFVSCQNYLRTCKGLNKKLHNFTTQCFFTKITNTVANIRSKIECCFVLLCCKCDGKLFVWNGDKWLWHYNRWPIEQCTGLSRSLVVMLWFVISFCRFANLLTHSSCIEHSRIDCSYLITCVSHSHLCTSPRVIALVSIHLFWLHLHLLLRNVRHIVECVSLTQS